MSKQQASKGKVFVVFREACLQEDEGKRFYVGSAATRKDAELVVEREVRESKGYFSKNDYSIFEGPK